MSFEHMGFNLHVIKLNNEYEIKKELENIKADKKAFDILINKMSFLHIKLENVDTRAANILKQYLHSMGGEAAISREAYSYTERATDIILSASKETLKHLAKRILNLPYDLSKVGKEIDKSLASNHGIMKFSESKVFDFRHKTYIMAILNLSKIIKQANGYSSELLLKKVDSMIKAGINIINICLGEDDDFLANIKNNPVDGNSLNKLLPIIRNIREVYKNIVLSIDTCKYLIAKESLEAGIDMLIESQPIKYNEQMLHLVAQRKCPLVLMHSNSGSSQLSKPLNSISDVIREIQSNISFAMGQGIDRDKLIIEPGIGFGRSHKDNFLILKQLSTFKYLNIPILVRLPKHSFLGEALRGKMRRTQIGSIAANTMAIINGANIVRVHDFEQAVAMGIIIDAIKNIEDDI